VLARSRSFVLHPSTHRACCPLYTGSPALHRRWIGCWDRDLAGWLCAQLIHPYSCGRHLTLVTDHFCPLPDTWRKGVIRDDNGPKTGSCEERCNEPGFVWVCIHPSLKLRRGSQRDRIVIPLKPRVRWGQPSLNSRCTRYGSALSPYHQIAEYRIVKEKSFDSIRGLFSARLLVLGVWY